MERIIWYFIIGFTIIGIFCFYVSPHAGDSPIWQVVVEEDTNILGKRFDCTAEDMTYLCTGTVNKQEMIIQYRSAENQQSLVECEIQYDDEIVACEGQPYYGGHQLKYLITTDNHLFSAIEKEQIQTTYARTISAGKAFWIANIASFSIGILLAFYTWKKNSSMFSRIGFFVFGFLVSVIVWFLFMFIFIFTQII